MPQHLAGGRPDRAGPPRADRPAGPRPRPRDHPGTRGLAACALVAVLLLVAGCGLRLETQPPAPLVPGAEEQARQRTVADALALGTTARLATGGARSAAAGTPDGDGVALLLAQTAEAAATHVSALGGPYDPGGTTTEEATGTPAPAPSVAAAVAVPDVVALLRDSSGSARADALTVPDGGLARLLASIAIHRLVLAERVADAAGDAARGDEPDGGERPAGSGEPTSDPGRTTARHQALVDLVRAEDAAGQAWEVAAARWADEARTDAEARAAQHRDAARDWALSAGLTGPDDPRLADYALPDGLLMTGPTDATDAAEVALAGLERDLAARYLALLAAQGADSDGRARLLDAATQAVRTATALDGILPPLPGMPEQTH